MTTTVASTKRLQLATRLLVLGLAASAGTLLWDHPLAFVVFVLLGFTLSLAGAGLFVWTVVASR